MTAAGTVLVVGDHDEAVASALEGVTFADLRLRTAPDEAAVRRVATRNVVDVYVVHERTIAEGTTNVADLRRAEPEVSVVRISDPETDGVPARVTGRWDGDAAFRERTAIATTVCAALENRHAIPAETAISAISEAFRDGDFETPETVCEAAVSTAATSLALPYATVALFDEDTGLLRPVAHSPALSAADEPQDLGPDLPHVWRAFGRGVTTTFGSDTAARLGESLSSIACGIAVPMGENGVILTGTPDADEVAASTVDAVELLATTARLALDRVRSERNRKNAERRLDRQNERLDRVVHINDKVRKMDQALVRADTRPEIEQIVCDRLLTSDRFAFAWIGELDAERTALRPRSTSGDGDDYLDEVSLCLGDEAAEPVPAIQSIQSGEVTIVERVTEGLHGAKWREEALLRDFLSVASIPLVYADVTYGVVSVYASVPAAFDSLAVSVLTEMGETIGYAIDAAERRAALTSEAVTELTVRLSGRDDVFGRMARQFDARVTIQSLAARESDETVVYATVAGAPTDGVVEAAEGSVSIDRIRVVSERDQRFEFVVSGSPLPVTLADLGATPEVLTAVDSAVCVTVTLPGRVAVRTFADRLSEEYGDVTVLSQRTRSGPERSRHSPTEGASLTDRQREVFEAAFYGGYFEWPREQTGEELAETLDISQPAFLQHLRACQKKLAEAYCRPE